MVHSRDNTISILPWATITEEVNSLPCIGYFWHHMREEAGCNLICSSSCFSLMPHITESCHFCSQQQWDCTCSAAVNKKLYQLDGSQWFFSSLFYCFALAYLVCPASLSSQACYLSNNHIILQDGQRAKEVAPGGHGESKVSIPSFASSGYVTSLNPCWASSPLGSYSFESFHFSCQFSFMSLVWIFKYEQSGQTFCLRTFLLMLWDNTWLVTLKYTRTQHNVHWKSLRLNFCLF